MSHDPRPDNGDYAAEWRIREHLAGLTYLLEVGLDGGPSENDVIRAIAEVIDENFIAGCAIEYRRMNSDEPWKPANPVDPARAQRLARQDGSTWTDPADDDFRRELAEAHLSACIHEVLAGVPPLTEEQCDRLAVLLRVA